MMKKLFVYLGLLVLTGSCTRTYYIVRHAEKSAEPAKDPVLTAAGQERAERLKLLLADKHIAHIFSTATTRTMSTAQPTSMLTGVPIEDYGPKPDSLFINRLKQRKRNTLIVGHSNTIDDIANMLCRKKVVAGDLPDTAFSNIFMVKMKGERVYFSVMHY